MFEFQYVLAEMRQKIIEARMKNVPENLIQESVARVDKLFEIYKSFDAFYYSAHFSKQKILQLEMDKMIMSSKIEELQEENEDLQKAAEWNQQK